MDIRGKEELQEIVNQGKKVKYIFFWGHQEQSDVVTKSCLSQWYNSSFKDGTVIYKTAEHYMMAEKARLFGDEENAQRAIKALSPSKAKSIGRQVKGFNELLWLENRFDIVYKANILKFSQNQHLKEFLLSTKERVLVEASPVDKIWGIGLASDDPRSENPNQWQGLNLLGFVLMAVRKELQ